MPTEADQSFADSVIRLRLADESRVSECLKTVADGGSPSLSQVMIERGLLNRDEAARVLEQTGAPHFPGEAPPVRMAPASDGDVPVITGYDVLAKLGEGGMGTVWKARQTSLDRLVAIKILPPVLSANGNFISRFRREALATARLNHRHIVSAIDVGVEKSGDGPEVHYFVMEFVDGESLEDIIGRAGKLTPERTVEIATAVAKALDHAWSNAGIVHRDVKPGNILVARSGAIKLADMGLARSAWEDASLTSTGLAIGTPHYASPEQAQGKADIDTRSDIYALGATMFRMLTGRTPFDGSGAAEVMAKHVTEDAPDARSIDPTVPQALSAMTARMMQRDVEARYQTAGELLADLERYERGDRPLAFTHFLAARESTRTGSHTRPPEVFQADAPSEPKPRRKAGHLPHAVGALLLLAAVGVGLWYLVEHYARAQAPVTYANRVSLWFNVQDPNSSVGAGGDFPIGFSPSSKVQCRIRPREPAYVYVVMATAPSGGAATVRLLTPGAESPTPQLTSAFRPYPGDGMYYPVPSDAATAVVLAVASREVVDRAKVVKELAELSQKMSESGGLGSGMARGQALWYGHKEDGWTRGAGTPASGSTGVALDELIRGIRGVFRRGASITAAATNCSGK
jgi:eukaryotic-like serine/threonine-protein kinase